MSGIDWEEYTERVLQCVEQVPSGRATTYGVIAEVVGATLGGGGPRLVGSVMAAHGGPVPWWRVVRADGSLPSSHQGEARLRYVEEGTPLRASGNVDIKRALFRPQLGRLPWSAVAIASCSRRSEGACPLAVSGKASCD